MKLEIELILHSKCRQAYYFSSVQKKETTKNEHESPVSFDTYAEIILVVGNTSATVLLRWTETFTSTETMKEYLWLTFKFNLEW